MSSKIMIYFWVLQTEALHYRQVTAERKPRCKGISLQRNEILILYSLVFQSKIKF